MDLFGKRSVGIDIADHTIEVAEVKGAIKDALTSLGRVTIPEGVVVRGRIKDEEALRALLKRALLEARPRPITTRKAVFGLPESHVYTHMFSAPEGFERKFQLEKDEYVRKEIEQVIPLETGDMLFSYRVITVTPGKKEILAIASSKSLVLEWDRFFRKLGIGIELFDTEVLALRRNIKSIVSTKEPICLVDVGALTTNIAIFDAGGIRYSYSVGIAGESLTADVAQSLKIRQEEAEDKKVKIGLTDENDKEVFVLIKALEPLVEEIKAAQAFYKERYGADIGKLVLAGGSSRMPGLVHYLETNLSTSVVLAESNLVLPSLTEGFQYIEAVGLAIRGLRGVWDTRDPALTLVPMLRGNIFSEFIQSKKIYVFAGLGVVAVALLGVGVVAGWRAWSHRKIEPTVDTATFTIKQTLRLRIPVAISSLEYTDDRLHGRVVEYPIDKSKEYKDALLDVALAAEKDLKQGEQVWKKPITQTQDSISLLVYSNDEAQRLFTKAIEVANTAHVGYRFESWEPYGLEPTENEHVYFMSGDVVIVAAALMPDATSGAPDRTTPTPVPTQAETSPGSKTPAKGTVLIKETETGWLNVRSGAGASFVIIRKIYPGDRFEFLSESKDWIQLRFSDNTTGWVATRYVQKL